MKSKVKRWRAVFNVDKELTRGENGKVEISYYILDKVTGEKIFPSTRGYGYGTFQDACRGAAQLYNSIQKSIEKDLLGQP